MENFIFLTVTDNNFFTGTLSTINSILHHHPMAKIIVVDYDSGSKKGLSYNQKSFLNLKENITIYDKKDFLNGDRVIGGWQAKTYVTYDLLKKDEAKIIISIDSDCFIMDDLNDVIKLCLIDGKIRGGKDGDGKIYYNNEYKAYDLPVDCIYNKYMSTAIYFVPNNEINKNIFSKAAEYTNKAIYGPQKEKIYPGYGDQGVLNAVIDKCTNGENVEFIENEIWSMHWVYDHINLYLKNGKIINQTFFDKPMRAFHTPARTKMWEINYDDDEKNISYVFMYSAFLKYLFNGSLNLFEYMETFRSRMDFDFNHLAEDFINYKFVINKINGPSLTMPFIKKNNNSSKNVSQIIENNFGQNKYFTIDYFNKIIDYYNHPSFNQKQLENYPKKLNEKISSFVFDSVARNIPKLTYSFEGAGIIMPAGGESYLTNAYINIRNLRDLGTTLPIQIWHLGDEEILGNFKELVRDLDVEFVNAKIVSEFLPNRILNGWELKSYALKWSPFNLNLLLDPDSFAVVDPNFIFSEKEFIDNGAVFFSDATRLPLNGNYTWGVDYKIWDLANIKEKDELQFESGQIFIEKNKCWGPIYLASWMNEYSDFWYKYFYGDKQTFQFSWMKLGHKYFLNSQNDQNGESLKFLLQNKKSKCHAHNHFWKDNLLFQHLTSDKKYKAFNKKNCNLLHYQKHMEYMDFLIKNWSIYKSIKI
jgi:hypothetical protein